MLTPDELPGYWRELFEERAAIMEFDGNLSREEAERLAMEDIMEMIASMGEGDVK